MERALERDGAQVAVLTRLGAAYRAAGQSEDARRVLQEALALDSLYAPAGFFLGLELEAGERYQEAADLYARFAAHPEGERLSSRMADRLPYAARRAMESRVRRAVADEEGLAATVDPQTVAVFPFPYLGSDESLRPLGRAFAQFLVTDLSRTDRLRVLERAEVQTLLDEIALSGTDLVEPVTAARSGRLLGAGRIVQGQLTGSRESLDWQVTVAAVGTGDLPAPVPLAESEPVERLFDAEKRIALAVYSSLGIELTVSEREQVLERPTANVQALLAYGLGLEREDAGDSEAALAAFRQARSLDAGFEEAGSAIDRVTAVAAAATVSLSVLGILGGLEFPAIDLGALFDGSVFAPLEALLPLPLDRDVAAEFLGIEGIGGGGTRLDILLRRPGG